MQEQHGYANPYTVAASSAEARATFIQKTYYHLAGGILAFAALEAVLLSLPGIDKVARAMMGQPILWLVVLGVFMFAQSVANRWALSETSKSTQYAGLGLLVVAEALIFLPILYIAKMQAPDVILKAGVVTFFLLAGITLVALTTKKDFSFLGGILKIGGFLALGMIVVSLLAPMVGLGSFTLGTWFSYAMVMLAAGSILYTTSNMVHHYRTDQYVAASLGLLASVLMMFWYIIRIFMSRD